MSEHKLTGIMDEDRYILEELLGYGSTKDIEDIRLDSLLGENNPILERICVEIPSRMYTEYQNTIESLTKDLQNNAEVDKHREIVKISLDTYGLMYKLISILTKGGIHSEQIQ